MVSGSADAQQTKVTTGKEGGVAVDGDSYHIILCLVAPEDTLGGVGTPPATVAALRSGLVHAGLVVDVGVREDWGGGRGGSRDEGGWRHFWRMICGRM